MPISLRGSTGATATGAVIGVYPPTASFAVQVSGGAGSVRLFGSLDGETFTALSTATAFTDGQILPMASTIGPMAHVRLDQTAQGSTSVVIVGTVVGAGTL